MSEAAVVALGDQPGITPAVVAALIEAYRRHLLPFTVPTYQGRRGNPVLMQSAENRKVILAARKLEDENGSADFLSRAQFMYDQFEAKGGREKWPQLPSIRTGRRHLTPTNPQPGQAFLRSELFALWSGKRLHRE